MYFVVLVGIVIAHQGPVCGWWMSWMPCWLVFATRSVDRRSSVLTCSLGPSKRLKNQVRKLFRSVDEDGSGVVSFTEFAEFLFPEMDVEDDQEHWLGGTQ